MRGALLVFLCSVASVWSQWSPTGSLAFGRDYHTATLLNTGNVLICGGYGTGGITFASCELYNTSSGLCSATGILKPKLCSNLDFCFVKAVC